MIDDEDDYLSRCVFVIGFIIILLGACAVVDYYYNKYKTSTSSPVEEIIKVDSITKVNDKLVIEVNNLDSIKDAKTIEVKSLDNDSTLKLFYQLIRRK